jgi:hypothetical protein
MRSMSSVVKTVWMDSVKAETACPPMVVPAVASVTSSTTVPSSFTLLLTAAAAAAALAERVTLGATKAVVVVGTVELRSSRRQLAIFIMVSSSLVV